MSEVQRTMKCYVLDKDYKKKNRNEKLTSTHLVTQLIEGVFDDGLRA